MRWIRNVSLATLGALLTLAGLAGGTWMVVHRALVARGAAEPQMIDFLNVTAAITIFVVGFGLLVMNGPQISDDQGSPLDPGGAREDGLL